MHAADAATILEIEQGQNTEDLAFFVNIALRTGGPVLDLGCGTGRLAIPIARAGIEIVGLDISVPMLARFHEKLAGESSDSRKNILLIRGDMRQFLLRRQFRCAICSSNTLFLLGSEGNIAEGLKSIRSHLEPGGMLIIDVAAIDSETRAALKEYPDGDFPDLDLTECVDDHSIRRTHSIESNDKDGREDPRCVTIRYKYFDGSDNLCFERAEDIVLLSPPELVSLVERMGFEIRELFGWYDRRVYSGGERKLIVLARRKE
jgi:SAM-dependent methyltransferase